MQLLCGNDSATLIDLQPYEYLQWTQRVWSTDQIDQSFQSSLVSPAANIDAALTRVRLLWRRSSANHHNAACFHAVRSPHPCKLVSTGPVHLAIWCVAR